MRKFLFGVVLMVGLTAAHAAIKEEPITYRDGETTMKGFVVYDDAVKGKRPGIVVVHEWWGITKHVHNEARKYAQQGYAAFIADMYGNAKTADNPKDAGALSGSVTNNPQVMQSRFNAARAELAKNSHVDANKIGAAGYCFGGTVVLNMVRTDADLLGVVAFHPGFSLSVPAPKGVKARVLVQKGTDDPFVKPEQVQAFKKDMDAAKADYRIIDYPGAKHAFTNPEATGLGKKFNIPIAYDADADKKSKAEATKFFADVFK